MSLIPAPERNMTKEETGLTHRLILRFLEAGSPFQTKVEVRAVGWLFWFSDFQVDPQNLTLGFYYLCCTTTKVVVYFVT